MILYVSISSDSYGSNLKLSNYFCCRPKRVLKFPRILTLPFKAIFQFFVLLWMMLFQIPRPDVILVQLPPALPTMVVCWLAARKHGARLVYDWHNFAYTLMALTMGHRHVLVRLAEWYERFWARKGDGGLCVTKAMQTELNTNWHAEATVFYDRPPTSFHRSSTRETHELFLKLSPVLGTKVHPNDFVVERLKTMPKTDTLCTTRPGGASGKVTLLPDRPAIIITSTSWTPDEDFGLLMDAMKKYDLAARRANLHLPHVIVFITGRGPQRENYEQEMQKLDLRKVAFRTVWLEPSDYPILLGSADLGISLHSSSSGLDLPMKVVDMFGAGTPVLALSYNCIEELVANNRNGILFVGSAELVVALKKSLKQFPNSPVLNLLAQGVEESKMSRWHDSWVKIALPVIEGK